MGELVNGSPNRLGEKFMLLDIVILRGSWEPIRLLRLARSTLNPDFVARIMKGKQLTNLQITAVNEEFEFYQIETIQDTRVEGQRDLSAVPLPSLLSLGDRASRPVSEGAATVSRE